MIKAKIMVNITVVRSCLTSLNHGRAYYGSLKNRNVNKQPETHLFDV